MTAHLRTLTAASASGAAAFFSCYHGYLIGKELWSRHTPESSPSAKRHIEWLCGSASGAMVSYALFHLLPKTRYTSAMKASLVLGNILFGAGVGASLHRGSTYDSQFLRGAGLGTLFVLLTTQVFKERVITTTPSFSSYVAFGCALGIKKTLAIWSQFGRLPLDPPELMPQPPSRESPT